MIWLLALSPIMCKTTPQRIFKSQVILVSRLPNLLKNLPSYAHKEYSDTPTFRSDVPLRLCIRAPYHPHFILSPLLKGELRVKGWNKMNFRKEPPMAQKDKQALGLHGLDFSSDFLRNFKASSFSQHSISKGVDLTRRKRPNNQEH